MYTIHLINMKGKNRQENKTENAAILYEWENWKYFVKE